MSFQKDGPRSWLYLAVILIMMLTVQSINNSSGILVAIFIEHFNETNARAGWVTSIVFFQIFALCPLAIYTWQTLGFRKSMTIAGFLYILAFLTTPFVSSLNWMFLTYSLPFGVALSFVSQLSIRTQKEYFQKFHGVALGVRFSGVGLGSVLISFFLPNIYEKFGFKITFLSPLVFAPVFLIIALVSRTHLNDTHNDNSWKENMVMKFTYCKEFFQDKSFVFCLIGTSAFFFVCLGPILFVVRYAVTLGYPLSKSKWLIMIRNLTALPARLIVGRFGDIAFRHGKVKLVVQFTYPIFGLASFLCSFVSSFPLLMVYMAVNGVIDGVFWVTLSLYVDEITGGYHSDEAYSLICLISAFVCLIGPPFLGWLFDITSDFRYVFYTIFVVSLFAGFMVTCSSFVSVKEELALMKKGQARTVISEASELTTNIDETLPTNYETSL